MANPEDYKAIAAWGRMMGSCSYYITHEQEKAAKENAPLDAIFKLAPTDNYWYCLSDVTNKETVKYFKLKHPELFTKKRKPHNA